MSNMIDYLAWRGDLSLKTAPFCDADNILLSEMSYTELDGIVPGVGSREKVTVAEASRAFFSRHTEKEIEASKSFVHLAPYALRAMAESSRFSNATLSHYQNKIDLETQEQFSAIHINLEDGTVYVAFRGTDNTLVGWREDCNLALGVVPAQLDAVAYLLTTTRGTKQKYRIGGHSKGGNLALYAASQSSEAVQSRILSVYCNDGPGLLPDQIQSSGYTSMLPRMRMIAPEGSLIGMLFCHEEPITYIESSNSGVMEHDALSWQILGTGFVEKRTLNSASTLLRGALNQWIDSLNSEQRQICIEAVFHSLDATGARTLEDIANGGLKSIQAIASGAGNVDPQAKAAFAALLKTLATAVRDRYLHLPQHEKAFRR